MDKRWLFSIVYFFCTFLTVLLFHSYLASEHNEVIAYSDFQRLVQDRKILDVEIGDRTITADVDLTGTKVTTSAPEGATKTYEGPGHRRFVTFRVNDPNLLSDLQARGIRYSAARTSHWLDEALSVLAAAVVFLGIWFYVIRLLGSPPP